MLKTTKYIYILLLLFLFGAAPQAATAQTTDSTHYFTLTNGHYYWFGERESDPDDSKYLTGYDRANGWEKIYNLGTHVNESTTEIVVQGDTYLALDTTTNPPSIQNISTDGGFNRLCVWYRTGNTGHYYQEWNGYRYYLYASHNEGLSIYKVAVGQQMTKSVTWYNWDHGAAIEEEERIPGGTRKSDYWLIYDTLNDADGSRAATPEWRMSTVHCYQRPEEIIYSNYRADGSGGNTWDTMYYYDNVRVGGLKNYPAGVAATFLPVTVIEHPREISSMTGGMGLSSVETDEPTVSYGESIVATANVHTTTTDDIASYITSEYTEYREETYRRGINLDYTLRTTNTFNNAGIPTYNTKYYYSNDLHPDLPMLIQSMAEVDSVRFDLDSRAKRYLTLGATTYNPAEVGDVDINVIDSMTDAYMDMAAYLIENGYTTPENPYDYYGFPIWSHNPDWIYFYNEYAAHNHPYRITVTCDDVPDNTLTATITAYVFYNNGTQQTMSTTFTVTPASVLGTPHAKNGPVVMGSVFGGARMANVQGNTSVIVHNTDSIYALYGGNDVAGWVQGEEGATVQIGTRNTSEEHPVHIGWVYGGGCGFYTYQGINIAHDEEGNPVDPYVHSGKTNLEYQAYFFNGKVYKWNSLPSDYESNANQVVSRYSDRMTNPSSWTDEQVMSGYYSASWREEDLVEDHGFSYIPYYYCNTTDPANPTTDITQAYSTTVDVTEDGNGSACMANKDYLGTVPYIKTAHVTVGVPEVSGHSDDFGDNAHEHNDYILIDSLFGGAENAFIGVQGIAGNYQSAITVDINGGTVKDVFGGNNYGGSIAQTAMTLVNVHCTKMTDDESLTANSYFGGYGRDFGIRHVFGGGNNVESPHTQLSFYGGMVDTAFVGGNHASVNNPVGIIECRRDGTVYDAGGVAQGQPGFTTPFMNGHFIYTNPTLEDTTYAGLRDVTKNLSYIPDNGLYNVHFLFGGNNKADMDNVSFIQLHVGGVGAVLAGGNEGDMVNDESIDSAVAGHLGYIDIRPLVQTMTGIFQRARLVTAPEKFGAVLAANENSRIIADYVHGGCRKANVKNSCGVYLGGGSYFDVFAGNDVSGDVGSESDGATYAVITGDAVIHANVYGGNDGYYHCNDGTGHYTDNKMGYDQFHPDFDYDPYGEMVGLLLPTQNHANVFVNGGLIKGDLVVGGLLANVGFSGDLDSRPLINDHGTERAMNGSLLRRGTVRLEIGDTARILGNVFGGGAFASIYGLSQVLVHGSPILYGSLFAGNDCLGQVNSFLPYQSNVDYTGCSTAADSLTAERANQAAQVSTSGDPLNKLEEDGTYNAAYTTYLRIEDSPIINSVYGSGNGAWNYDGTRPQFPTPYICAGQEGNVPDQASTYIDINTSGGFIDTVFGGGNGCSVSDAVVVLLNNRDVDNPSYPRATLLDSIRAQSLSLGRTFVGGTTNSSFTGTNFVGSIFGGNNFNDMNVVPDIRLVKGNVKNVYGGGNAGNMTGLTNVYDICGHEVKDVSTHVLASSENVTVTDSVFGGCRMSDIEGMAYVDVRKTSTGGIQYLYGGNDISGNVKGNTRIDMAGGLVQRVWGGSNGRYDFVPVGYQLYNVYPFGSYDEAHPDRGLIATAGKPNVDSTLVNLWGGTINASVFTGGSMADCRATCLVVDDQVGCDDGDVSTGHITVNGALYGGGEGRWDDLNARDLEGNRWGNINGSTHVHLHHADNVTSAMAYGGGGGGDVHNTYIKTYDSWNSPFAAIFGGCWGSDVYGTAHLEFNGKELVKNLYGGNDFTGNVYKSEIVVNSGNFFNVFGGGNGDYPDSYYTSQHASALAGAFAYQHASPTAYAGSKSIERPNTEYVTITFNDGVVDSCLYGGGRMGTILPYQKDANGDYVYNMVDTNATPTATEADDLARFIPDTMRTVATTFADDPEKLSYVVLNVHGGKFHRNVFGGGRGYKQDKKAIVYGLKVVNMDGGEIYESLYGGSEFVNDGYYAECKAPAGENPTQAQRLAVTSGRPSSIVNLTGGTVGANLYGTGYQGMVYGSSYVNIGKDAIDSCTVWRNHYGTDTQDSSYKIFKPGYAGGHSDALTADKLILKASVYSGANWGNASGESEFNSPGFVGGESRLYIDGKGYNTTNDYVTSDPEMNIKRSIYGSGTSVLGGDVHSHVELRNYGDLAFCLPTKSIETIQRADSVWLHNTALLITGTTDASQQYMSNRYSMMNLGVLSYRGYNVTEFQAAVSQVDNLGFYEQGSTGAPHTAERFDTVEVPVLDINEDITGAACGDNVDICDKEYMVSSSTPDKRHTLLILDNGVDLNIGDGTNYGGVTGFGFVTTPGGYQSTITARPKVVYSGDANAESHNATDGGFVTTCDTVNKTRNTQTALNDVNPGWSETSTTADELPYTNHATAIAMGFTGSKYRVWKVGDKQGVREAEATLLAHTNPAKLQQDWSINITEGASPNTQRHRTGIAEAMFELPATTAGHYYQLTGEGFLMQGSNGDIYMVDSAWTPYMTGAMALGGNLNMASAMSSIGSADPDTKGGWETIPGNIDAADKKGTVAIHQSPGNTFGLIMVPNGNFATTSTVTSTTTETGWHTTSGNYFYYIGGAPELSVSGTVVDLWDGSDDIEIDLNDTRNFIAKACDPDDDEDAGTIWWQDGTSTTLQSYDMNLEEGDDGYNSTLHNRFAALDYSCGDYSYESYGTYSQDHYSYAYDMPFRRDDSGNLIDANGNPVAVGVPHESVEAHFVIEGNARVNSVEHYCSPKVFDNGDASNPELKPSMRFYLTYDTTFTAAFTGTVTFQLMEYDADGHEVAPINVKVYIQTIIDSLKDVEQDVLAMYNGGRTNTFTRKIELPPVGEERNLYITGIKWLPTDGNGNNASATACSTAFSSADRFSLLGDSSLVQEVTASYPFSSTDPDHSSHNRFALTIIPTNNMSEDVNTANGWLRGNDIRTNIYKLAYPSGDGDTPVKTLEWNSVGDSVDTVSLRSVENENKGFFVGTLDGRGSAVIDVELTFDGSRTYDRVDGKGYVGKAVLSLESISDEDNESRGTFHVTIYVKTREHGDTIYIASANSVTRQIAPNKSITLYPYNDPTHHTIGSYETADIGKKPSLYVQTFRKALEAGVYQEGDVLCILDTVKIDANSTPVHITGPNGPPIEVIRYDGHHYELPDEQSVYRGPMIAVSGGNTFTAQNIAFHGGAGAKITKVQRATPGNDASNAVLDGSDNLQFVNSHSLTVGETTYNFTSDKQPDTNMVWAPIIQATGDGTTVNLREGTIVQHNWNGYTHQASQRDANGWPLLTRNMGAISLTNAASLTLSGNVTVENNFGHTMTGYEDLAHDSVSVQKAPGNGAIYVDGGTIVLSEANRNTAVTITDNYLMTPTVHLGSASWWTMGMVGESPERFILAPESVSTWHKANVYLTRKEAASATTHYEQVLNDDQSDIIVITGTVGDSTKIGVRKWFPGIHERDTIQIVTVEGGNNTLLANAMANGSFQSDDHFRVFYNSLVDLTTGYFFRCATFRHQLASDTYVAPVHDRYSELTLRSNDVLHFGVKDNICPAGGDSIIYRVQGGLMPYTYTWSDPNKVFTLQEKTTPYSNTQVQYDLAGALDENDQPTLTGADRYAKYAASIADTLMLPNEPVTASQKRKWNHLRVTATDATGACELYKDIDLRILMDHEATDAVTYKDYASATVATDTAYNAAAPNSGWATTPANGWTDTSRTVKAIASRNFNGVQITPRVWVDRSMGTISAAITGKDYVYQYVDGEDYHELEGLNFCPGDTLFLYTEQTANDNKFIMWDFDPYYRQLARYIVPPQDATVTAYYGPENYWHQHITNESEADAIYDGNYTYTGNGGHSFVNTYNGDVHIYDEKGLAWLISRVNGLNGQQARTFRFNRVLIHDKTGGYDMKGYRWYPLGTEQHPFMGRLFGVGSDATADLPWQSIGARMDTVPYGEHATDSDPSTWDTVHDGSGNPVWDTTWYAPVVIKNIVLDETQMYSVGFFGYMDSAGVYNLSINGELVRGSQYVGGLAGTSAHSYVRRSRVQSDIEDADLDAGFGVGQIPTTILTTHYVSGGMLGKSERDTVQASQVAVKFVGDAVYSGGGIGYGNGSIIRDVMGHNFTRLQGLYLGGMAGYLDGSAPVPTSFLGRLFGRKTAGIPSMVQNNYFRITSTGNTQRLGGVVGYAENTVIENNYIYGDLQAMNVGGVTALAANGTQANHNYYSSKSASRASYRTQGNADLGYSSDFEGQGNQVTLSEPTYGSDNLTRVLNIWVRERNANGAHFETWRSDLASVNSGYPLFGRPDLIPVSGGTTTVDACEGIEIDGVYYTSDSTIVVGIIDSVQMIDSSVTTIIRIHHGAQTDYVDSATYGESYAGYGFTVTPTEQLLLQHTIDSVGYATLVLTDTLPTVYGCDSVITLTLTFYGNGNNQGIVEVSSSSPVTVYPNPTSDIVNVEAEEMSRVEIYDNEGRCLRRESINSGELKVRLDLSPYASGIYFIRVHTPRGITIQKVVKR